MAYAMHVFRRTVWKDGSEMRLEILPARLLSRRFQRGGLDLLDEYAVPFLGMKASRSPDRSHTSGSVPRRSEGSLE